MIEKLRPRGQVYFKIVKAWIRIRIRTSCMYIETEAEYHKSRVLFDRWLDSAAVGDNAQLTHTIALQVRDILIKSFQPHEEKFTRGEVCLLLLYKGDNEQWKIDLDGLVDDAYKVCQEQVYVAHQPEHILC